MAFLLRIDQPQRRRPRDRPHQRGSTTRCCRIGRDPNCDIRLNDLAVALHHATLELVGEGQLGVSAEMGHDRSRSTAAPSASARSISIRAATSGSGRSCCASCRRRSAAEDVSIDIERAEDDAAAEKVDVRRFALASVMPGKRPMAWVLAVLVLAIFLAWPIWSFYQGRTEAARYAQGYHADRMWLSGSLSQGHASLERQLPGLPRRAVRPGPRRRLQGLPHRHPRPCRPAPAGARRRPHLGGFRRLQHDDRRAGSARTRAAASIATPSMRAPQRMPPTPQQFCADCHTDLRARLPDTRLASASDFAQRPSRIPAAGAGPLGRRAAAAAAGRARPASARDEQPQIPARAPSRSARRRGADGPAAARPLRLRRQRCNAPTATCRRRTAPASSRSTWRRDCGMCHSLAFDQIGGTIRTLRHGSPAQVIGDIRAPLPRRRAAAPARAQRRRARPARRRRPDPRRRPVRPRPRQPRQRAPIRRSARSSRRAAPASIATRWCSRRRARSTTASARSPSRPATCCTAGSTIAQHQIMQRPGQPRLEGAAACASCHGADASNSAARPAAARPRQLPRLPWRRADQRAGRIDLRDVP